MAETAPQITFTMHRCEWAALVGVSKESDFAEKYAAHLVLDRIRAGLAGESPSTEGET